MHCQKQYVIYLLSHKSAAFVGGFNTINVPTEMVWASTASATKFSVVLHDKYNGVEYTVHLVADTGSKLGCRYMTINSAATCYYEPDDKLNISFDKALNKNLPSNITLGGHFSLKRLQWPDMNTTNIVLMIIHIYAKVSNNEFLLYLGQLKKPQS
jgi:hypothetical protein